VATKEGIAIPFVSKAETHFEGALSEVALTKQVYLVVPWFLSQYLLGI
jgi:hypothetical protein